jgi:hypothetical protein
MFLLLSAAGVAIGGWLVAAVLMGQFEMSLSTKTPVVTINEPFRVSVDVRSGEPTNVFSGTVQFDPTFLTVTSIDYNTSIADLWAAEPWFSEGDGSVVFTGGTTAPSGYTGNGSLLTITFNPIQGGETNLGIQDVTILRHDGLGTEVNDTTPLDVVFTIEPSQLDNETVLRRSVAGPQVQILQNKPNVDLNGDGVQSAADLSIFMLHLTTQNPRSDFDGNGTVSLRDLSILTRY